MINCDNKDISTRDRRRLRFFVDGDGEGCLTKMGNVEANVMETTGIFVRCIRVFGVQG